MGFRSSAEIIECSVSDLMTQYVSQTGPKVISKALGKVLFIDKAYRLDEGCFAGEAIDELVDCMTKTKFANKVIIILARYEAGMDKLMGVNQSLSSRFPTEVVFRSLEPGCCLQLIQHYIGKLGISVLGTGDLCCPIPGELLDLFAQLASFRSGVMDGHPNVGQDDFWRGVQKCALNPDIDMSISVTESVFFVRKMVLEKQQRELALCPGRKYRTTYNVCE